MKRFLVFVEQKGEDPRKVSLEILSRTYGLSHSGAASVEAVVAGALSETTRDAVLPYVTRLVNVTGPGLEGYTPEGYVAAIAACAKESQADVILAGATIMGRDFFPRLAVALQAGIASDVTDMTMLEDGTIRFVRPLYGGKVLSEVVFTGTPALATIRPNVFPLGEATGEKGQLVEKTLDAAQTVKTQVLRIEQQERKKADLTEADLIVAGGRGMKGAENFGLLEELSEAIGATVGASRSVVDAKWRDQEDQVGKSGKTVSPKLYIAAGISGAIHHIMGMDTSKVILAINKDPNAIIFTYADYGIVGDAMDVVPAMVEEIRKRTGK